MSHDHKLESLNRLNRVLAKLNQPTYRSISEINFDELNNFRKNTSTVLNNQFAQKNVLIAGYCNNVWIKTVYNGIFFNVAYTAIPAMLSRADEEKKQKITQFFDKYSPLIRVGIFGVSYLMARFSKFILQLVIKYGVRFVDHVLGGILDADSINKQWIGAILMAIITTRCSPFAGLVGLYDGFQCYKGYRENSDFFQQDLKELQTSIELVSKFK